MNGAVDQEWASGFPPQEWTKCPWNRTVDHDQSMLWKTGPRLLVMEYLGGLMCLPHELCHVAVFMWQTYDRDIPLTSSNLPV